MIKLKKIAIVTDGSCDLPKEIVEKYNIYVVPFQVIIGEKAYQMYGDYGTLSKEEFYKITDESEQLPTTSVPAPKSFHDTFEKAFEEAKAIIGIFLSSELSSTYQNAQLVVNTLSNKQDIHLIDSRVAASALGALVIEAAKMAQVEKSKNEIIKRLNELIPQARLICVLENVEATYRSGRIGWAKKFLVSAMKIRPIVVFKDGFIGSDGMFMGPREEIIKHMKFVAPIVAKKAITDTIFIWHVRSYNDALILKEEMEKANINNREIIIQEAGPVVGTHVGKGGLAYMYIGPYNKNWLLKMKE